MSPGVSIVIVNYNGVEYVLDAIASARAQRYDGPLEIVVVDNASSDESLRLLRATPGIALIENATNAGFGAGVNVALRAVASEYIALLNPDARAEPDWLSRTIPWMRAGKIDLASSIIGAGTETYFAGGRFFAALGTTQVLRKATASVDWITGCALVATRAAFERTGGFDEHFFLYYEDVDLCLRARAAGLRVGVLAERLVDHPQHGRSTDTLGSRKIEIAFYARGRLIGKHVRGWKLAPALLFASVVSPLRTGAGWKATFAMRRSLRRGFRSVRGPVPPPRARFGDTLRHLYDVVNQFLTR